MKAFNRLALLGLFFGAAACEVSDYKEINDPALPDGPQVYVTPPAASTIVSRRTDNNEVVWVLKGQTTAFDVEVVDAPGVIDSVSLLLSDTVGSAAVTNFDALIGNETGTFNYVYTPEPNDDASTFDDRVVNASLTVSDANKKTTQADVKRIRAIDCLPSRNLAGWWKAVNTGVSTRALNDGTPAGEFTINSFSRWQIRTTGTTTGTASSATVVGQPVSSTSNVFAESANELYIPDVTFGLYGAQAPGTPTRTVVGARLKFCGDQLVDWRMLNTAGTATVSKLVTPPTATQSGTTGAQYFKTLTGVINADGTVTLNYENYAGDIGTVTLTWDGY